MKLLLRFAVAASVAASGFSTVTAFVALPCSQISLRVRAMRLCSEPNAAPPTPRQEPCPGFPRCSGEYRERGCDGAGRLLSIPPKTYEYGDAIATRVDERQQYKESFGMYRIAGGVGALLPWLPVKAYRPCPAFVEAKYKYSRQGQSLDEVVFARREELPISDITLDSVDDVQETNVASIDRAEMENAADKELN